jgi:uncharacterized membrane protein
VAYDQSAGRGRVSRLLQADHVQGGLWIIPAIFMVGALAAGGLLSLIEVDPTSPLAFPGTVDDARALLINISTAMMTVIALVLGLTVVALQLSSTQFSPRLLRNFLRDRPIQLVLGAFVATFVYSVAGLYTVGVSGGERTDEYPRLAVSGAILLMFISLGLLVYFAHHLTHSIQIDSIMDVVQRNALTAIVDGLPSRPAALAEALPDADPLTIDAPRSGYIQAVRMDLLLATARRQEALIRLRYRVGEHVVAGTTLAWVWPATTSGRRPDEAACRATVGKAVRIGSERTFEQDAAFGIRQLVDITCKAMSPAINDPYTAVQAVQRLSVLFAALAVRPLGPQTASAGCAEVVIPGREFADYLATMCGLVRRHGAGEPTVAVAALQLLATCADGCLPEADRFDAVERATDLIVRHAELRVLQPEDLTDVHAMAEVVRTTVARRRTP